MVKRIAVALLVACLAAGCNKITDPSKNQIESFSGTLQPSSVDASQSIRFHNFNVPNSGEFSVKITALMPVSNLFMGTALGYAQNDGSCAVIAGQTNIFSQLNLTSLTGPITPNKYCVFIYDVGQMTVPETYTISVSHP